IYRLDCFVRIIQEALALLLLHEGDEALYVLGVAARALELPLDGLGDVGVVGRERLPVVMLLFGGGLGGLRRALADCFFVAFLVSRNASGEATVVVVETTLRLVLRFEAGLDGLASIFGHESEQLVIGQRRRLFLLFLLLLASAVVGRRLLLIRSFGGRGVRLRIFGFGWRGLLALALRDKGVELLVIIELLVRLFCVLLGHVLPPPA